MNITIEGSYEAELDAVVLRARIVTALAQLGIEVFSIIIERGTT